MDLHEFHAELLEGIPISLPPAYLPQHDLPHAPKRVISEILSREEKGLAVRNALRYFPEEFHALLASEFAKELEMYGRIYMYRFMPKHAMLARPIHEYPTRSKQAAAILLMLHNNLDIKIAKYPEELITYGGNGSVLQNWAQYRLLVKYLCEMTDEQTLVLYSGHPMGLFPSSKDAPRLVITNGMMIPNYSTKDDWNKYNALGVTQYGQMTAGSFMYIGPQGIVHGTTITLLNAGRLRGLTDEQLKGEIFVTSGLGGMSGAQAIASVITGTVGVIAEIDNDAIAQRVVDGYVQQDNVYHNIQDLMDRIRKETEKKQGIALVYSGNIVDLWQGLYEANIHVALGSDQTSLHNIDDLGYAPMGYTFDEAKELLSSDKALFMKKVKETLCEHVRLINLMCERGMYFWDYGNAFLKEAGMANADIWKDQERDLYKYPSYVQDIMGPMCFDYGFGPFRWVCASGSLEDLHKSDEIATRVLEEMLVAAPDEIKTQLMDNINWIKKAKVDIPVVGSKARILYADAEGRIAIAEALNDAIQSGHISAPIVLGRDHHDVSGTDSPYRETSNIYDGSRFTADMAIQNVIGDSFRGATWVSIHNGGGVGWGQVINGGFGLVIDGTAEASRKLNSMLYWDVYNGIARRSWARNAPAINTIKRAMDRNKDMSITVPNIVDDSIIDKLFS